MRPTRNSPVAASRSATCSTTCGGLLYHGHEDGQITHGLDGQRRLPGLHPERASYGSFLTFSDPDGNGWVLQEITQRFPGR